MGDVFVTFDLGTSRLKVAAFDRTGALLAQETRRHVEHARRPLRWQDADAWWRDAVGATRTLLGGLGIDRIAGMSLSGRGGAGVFTDARGEVLAHPWSDARHAAELDAIRGWRREHGLSSYGMALLAKWMWLERHDPGTARRVRHAFYAKDFLLHRLTGAALTDPSSGPDAMEWNAETLTVARIAPALLPQPVPPWHLTDGLTRTAAGALGLEPGTPVAVGAHDGIAANIGAGASRPGSYAMTLGTHAVIRTVTRDPTPGAMRFYGLPPDRHVHGGNAWLGGRAVDWFLDVAGAGRERAELERAADAVPPGAGGVLFLPFLGGRVGPDARPAARGSFLGLGVDTDHAALYRAVLEGVACALEDVLDALREHCGTPAAIRVTGGGGASPLWRRVLADVLNTPLEVTDGAAEGRGALAFLMVGLGHYPDYDAAADALLPAVTRIEPEAHGVERYAALHARWRRAVDVTRALDASPDV